MLFNNRMTGFSLDPASPNYLVCGKRTAHTLNAYVVTRPADDAAGGRDPLAFVGGTPGADVQVQSNLQVICNMIDFKMNPQEAIEAPQWQHDAGSDRLPSKTASPPPPLTTSPTAVTPSRHSTPGATAAVANSSQ